MQISKEEFINRVNYLAENNHKVRAILKANGGNYDNIPVFQKQLIQKELGVKVKVTVITEYLTID